ncbi:HD domain-containing protein 2 [Cephus cinctus]|uniref:5'-deoxynucleotidase HDDC2 n=1 Tax=Cephus cinctus TaxID=211228 RepID=A0AAJ7BJ69_CEPCN|nr:HD domain-containing protein 2 [Cephus cinctus]
MDSRNLVEFLELVGRLKHMARTGWVLLKIPNPETISGHMYRMAMLSFLVDSKENLNREKIMQMTLIHDLAECIVGDITPHCGVTPEDKHRREDVAMQEICSLLGDKGSEMLELFREYEKQESSEARYVKDLDRLDLIMQAFEYEKRDQIPGKLQEFFTTQDGKIAHPSLKSIADQIITEREALFRIPNNV